MPLPPSPIGGSLTLSMATMRFIYFPLLQLDCPGLVGSNDSLRIRNERLKTVMYSLVCNRLRIQRVDG